MRASASRRARASVVNVLRLVCPAVPMRPNATTRSTPSTATCQNFRELPPTNSKQRACAGALDGGGADDAGSKGANDETDRAVSGLSVAASAGGAGSAAGGAPVSDQTSLSDSASTSSSLAGSGSAE